MTFPPDYKPLEVSLGYKTIEEPKPPAFIGEKAFMVGLVAGIQRGVRLCLESDSTGLHNCLARFSDMLLSDEQFARLCEVLIEEDRLKRTDSLSEFFYQMNTEREARGIAEAIKRLLAGGMDIVDLFDSLVYQRENPLAQNAGAGPFVFHEGPFEWELQE